MGCKNNTVSYYSYVTHFSISFNCTNHNIYLIHTPFFFYMIKAFLSYNENTKETLFKPFTPLLTNVQSSLIQNFTSMIQKQIKDNYFTADIYTFSYITQKNTHFSLISENESDIIEMQYILNHIKPLLSDDLFNVNYIISEIFPYSTTQTCSYNLLNLDNIKNILIAESNDERIYENMMKSKELENYQKIKEMKKTNTIDKQLEKVRNIELEMRKEQIKQLEALKISNEPVIIKSKKRVKKIEGDFVVTIKEKLSVIVDKEMNIKECSINGDLSVLVKKEELRKEKIRYKQNQSCDVKYSPNINKTDAKNNVLHSEKGYPLNKNVALMKWKRQAKNTTNFMPLDFSFWVSELNDGSKFSVQFEYEEKQKLKYLKFYINKKNVQIENCKTVDGKYEWSGDNGVEIICDNYEDMFPIFVDFWSDECEFAVDVKDEEMNVQRIFEVEKFEIQF